VLAELLQARLNGDVVTADDERRLVMRKHPPKAVTSAQDHR
jgi:hypothetical protein